MPAAQPAVVARDLVKKYRVLEAVRSISFEVPPQSCFGFLGPNGAGKTTTMQLISCTLPPTSGTLEVLGMSVVEHPRQIKSRMGVVPQEDNLDEEITVLDNLLIHARYHGIRARVARPIALELLEFMELQEKKDQEIRELSGGMKRRLMIARGMLNSPEVLLLDEPTTGLDPQARHLVWERLRQLKRQGVTLLLTTHYMDEAAQLCDKLVIMHEGRVLIEGAPRDLVAQQAAREVVEVIEPPAELHGALAALEGVARSIEKLADRWLLYTDEGDLLLEKVRGLALPPGSVWLRGTTLEDVFLSLTGRGLLD
jgi:lipooligosaccharide transport system ATP-binding protein